MNTPSPLSSPLRLRCGTTLANRIAKSAMSEVLADRITGAPTEALVRLYERWGRSGAGLLITGHVIVDPAGIGELGNVVLTDDRHSAALKRWADAGRAGGAHLWMQINHAGRQTPRSLIRQPVAPSAVSMGRGLSGFYARPRALTEPEILSIIDRFATAASLAQRAGFSGVQLHCAHGYLLSQFLSPLANLRNDAWGGDPTRRSRLLLETVRSVRNAVGPAFPLSVKLNSADFQRGGFTIEESMEVARALDQAGVDLLEVSGGNFESPTMMGSGELPATQRQSSIEREAYFLEYAQRIRKVAALPILLTGGMRSRKIMEEALASGAVDVVGLARPMTHTPDLPARLLDGSLAVAPAVKIRSRIKQVDDALQGLWFQQQIHELGHGREPNLALGKWTALWRSVRDNYLRSGPG